MHTTDTFFCQVTKERWTFKMFSGAILVPRDKPQNSSLKLCLGSLTPVFTITDREFVIIWKKTNPILSVKTLFVRVKYKDDKSSIDAGQSQSNSVAAKLHCTEIELFQIYSQCHCAMCLLFTVLWWLFLQCDFCQIYSHWSVCSVSHCCLLHKNVLHGPASHRCKKSWTFGVDRTSAWLGRVALV